MHIETTIPSQKKTRYKLLSYYVFFTSKFAAYTDKYKQQWSNSRLTMQNKTYIAPYSVRHLSCSTLESHWPKHFPASEDKRYQSFFKITTHNGNVIFEMCKCEAAWDKCQNLWDKGRLYYRNVYLNLLYIVTKLWRPFAPPFVIHKKGL